MPTTRKSYPPTLKAKIAVEAIRAGFARVLERLQRLRPQRIGAPVPKEPDPKGFIQERGSVVRTRAQPHCHSTSVGEGVFRLVTRRASLPAVIRQASVEKQHPT